MVETGFQEQELTQDQQPSRSRTPRTGTVKPDQVQVFSGPRNRNGHTGPSIGAQKQDWVVGRCHEVTFGAMLTKNNIGQQSPCTTRRTTVFAAIAREFGNR